MGAAALGPDHVHYELQLKGVDPGSYTIFGNQAEDPACNGATVLIKTFTVEANRQGSASALFNFPVHDFGTTKVWVTVSGPAGAATTLFYRSPAVAMVIAAHVLGHEG